MPRFNIGDKVLVLGRYAQLFTGKSGIVVNVKADPLRPMFDEYAVDFAHRRHTVFDFQLVADTSNWTTREAQPIESARTTPPQHLRGIADRQILLQSADLDIHLTLTASDDKMALLGQILTRGRNNFLSDSEVRLLQQDIPIEVQNTNEV